MSEGIVYSSLLANQELVSYNFNSESSSPVAGLMVYDKSKFPVIDSILILNLIANLLSGTQTKPGLIQDPKHLSFILMNETVFVFFRLFEMGGEGRKGGGCEGF